MPEYEGVVGLEIHIQLKTKSKLFCGCRASYGAKPNTQVCPVCLGMPGVLPVLNKAAVDYALMMVLAIGGKAKEENLFARKNYFYPDLPRGYQISQFEFPLATGGSVLLVDENNNQKTIHIRELHLEEEAGKSFHDIDRDYSYIDFNRCGIPLIEIITEPDLNSGNEAYALLNKIKQLAEYLDITTGNMEEGALRCDVNVSVRPKGESYLNARHEIKNMNSFRFAQKAINYEIKNQIKTLEAGGEIKQQTMLWDEKNNVTRPMREKEEAHDYRYFPEPDLRCLKIDSKWIDTIYQKFPELPEKRYNRFMDQYGIRSDDASSLTASRPLADYYENVVEISNEPRLSANWIVNELLREIKNIDITRIKIPPEHLGQMINMIKSGEISGKIAKEIFPEMVLSGRPADEIVRKRGFTQISDDEHILTVIENVLSDNEDNVNLYLSGKRGLFEYFIGQVMKKTGGQANPQLVNRLLRQVLNKRGNSDV